MREQRTIGLERLLGDRDETPGPIRPHRGPKLRDAGRGAGERSVAPTLRRRPDIGPSSDRKPRKKANERAHLLHPVVSGFLFRDAQPAAELAAPRRLPAGATHKDLERPSAVASLAVGAAGALLKASWRGLYLDLDLEQGFGDG